jgi:hypothetical protein
VAEQGWTCHNRASTGGTDCVNVFFFYSWSRVWLHLVHELLVALHYQPRIIDEYGTVGGMRIARGNKWSHKICPIATLSTTDRTWPDLGSNLGFRSRKPAANCLSYGTTYKMPLPATHSACFVQNSVNASPVNTDYGKDVWKNHTLGWYVEDMERDLGCIFNSSLESKSAIPFSV